MASGSLQMGIFPEMVSDGLGGVLISWYQSVPALQSYVEQIHTNGTMRFGSGGFPVSLNTTRLRSSIEAVYDPEDHAIYAFWRETDGSQNQVGLYGQRIDENNDRSWGQDGIAIVDVAPGNDIGGLTTFVFDEDPVIVYTQFSGMDESQILARRFNSAGEAFWDDEIADISTLVSGKFRLNSVKAADDEVFMSWQDNRNGSSEIWAQNLFADGSLGEREDEPEPEPVIRDVIFSVDMSIQLMLIFQPENGDLVHVLGSFNDWSVSEENGSRLSPDPENPEIWTTQLSIEGDNGEEAQYKFFIEAGDDRTLPNNGWENNDVGPGENGNRVITLTEEDLALPVVFFNNDDGGPVGPPHPIETPDEFYLAQNYPNPFNPTTLIRYSLPEASAVRLEVYNSMGQRVSVVINGSFPAGEHAARFDGTQLSSGIYFYRLEAGNQVLTRKMTLIK
ncbi:MAG: T9SS type A sorting domain-containing protein [Balneolia bacterium]|nr:T9SS type A sorting domain-containing protein [Balneolia bacterium]